MINRAYRKQQFICDECEVEESDFYDDFQELLEEAKANGWLVMADDSKGRVRFKHICPRCAP